MSAQMFVSNPSPARTESPCAPDAEPIDGLLSRSRRCRLASPFTPRRHPFHNQAHICLDLMDVGNATDVPFGYSHLSETGMSHQIGQGHSIVEPLMRGELGVPSVEAVEK